MHQSDHILELARHRRVLRAADVREHGWSPQLLIRLHQAGKLQRFARGLYGLPDAEVTEHQTLIEVCQRVPKAVLCRSGSLKHAWYRFKHSKSSHRAKLILSLPSPPPQWQPPWCLFLSISERASGSRTLASSGR